VAGAAKHLTASYDIYGTVLGLWVGPFWDRPETRRKLAVFGSLSIPSLGRKHFLQAHPFTNISPAPTVGDKNAKLDLLIKAQQGLSSSLLRGAMERSSLTIRIDGPYGSRHAQSLPQDSDLALLVAGGSGMAVAWPLVDSLVDRNSSPKIILIWIIHRSSHLAWLGWPALQEAGSKGVQVIVPTATEEVGPAHTWHALVTSLVIEEGPREASCGYGLWPRWHGKSGAEYACADGAGRMGRWRYDREICVVDLRWCMMLARARRFETGKQVWNMAGNLWRSRNVMIHDTMTQYMSNIYHLEGSRHEDFWHSKIHLSF
jgi:hypothetical protein